MLSLCKQDHAYPGNGGGSICSIFGASAKKGFAILGQQDPSESHKPPQQEQLSIQYQQIGMMLLCCETASVRVGIPWLPPSKRVTDLRKQVDGPVKMFVRYNLVTMPTATLQVYYEQLISAEKNSASSEILGITLSSAIERYSCAAVSFIFFFILVSLGLTNAGSGTVLSLMMSSLVAGIAAFGTAFLFCDDHYRRFSFAKLLSGEIQRRRGNHSLLASPIGAPLETPPLLGL